MEENFLPEYEQDGDLGEGVWCKAMGSSILRFGRKLKKHATINIDIKTKAPPAKAATT